MVLALADGSAAQDRAVGVLQAVGQPALSKSHEIAGSNVPALGTDLVRAGAVENVEALFLVIVLVMLGRLVPRLDFNDAEVDFFKAGCRGQGLFCPTGERVQEMRSFLPTHPTHLIGGNVINLSAHQSSPVGTDSPAKAV